jgi:hypothetical protein
LGNFDQVDREQIRLFRLAEVNAEGNYMRRLDRRPVKGSITICREVQPIFLRIDYRKRIK